MEHVTVEENQVNTFLMTFQELNDISVKNRVSLYLGHTVFCSLTILNTVVFLLSK